MAIDTDFTLTPRAALLDITFGSIAGMVAELFEYPFDLAKVRLQAQLFSSSSLPSATASVTTTSSSPVVFAGPWDCLKRTWALEGVRGLYRGLPVPMFGSMGETASLFAVYTTMQNLLLKYNNNTQVLKDGNTPSLTLGQLALAGGGAGLITSFFLTPVELVKCQLQVQSVSRHQIQSSNPRRTQAVTRYPGPFNILTSTVRAQGLQGLWLGQTGTLIRETAGSATWFVCKEAVADLLVQRRLSRGSGVSVEKATTHTVAQHEARPLPLESAMSGAVAGAASVFALYPADTVKSVIQTSPNSSSSFSTTAVGIYKTHGLRGLYAGCGMTVARAVPTSAIIFVVYDGLVRWASA